MASTCPACPRTRATGHYLCAACWYRLPAGTRTALSCRGDSAIARYRALLDQLTAGTPLPDIRIQ